MRAIVATIDRMPMSNLLPLHLRPALVVDAGGGRVGPLERQFSRLVRIMLMYAGSTDLGGTSWTLAPPTGSKVLRLMVSAARPGPEGLNSSASSKVLRPTGQVLPANRPTAMVP